jgi:hypothetical protein
VVLVDAVLDLTFPDPSPAQLVAVTAFVKENISRQQPEGLEFHSGNADICNRPQVKATALDVCDPQVRHFNKGGIRLFVGILGNATNYVRELTQTHPAPPTWQWCQFTVVNACRTNLKVAWSSDCSARQGSPYGLGFEDVDPACDTLQTQYADVDAGEVVFENVDDAPLLVRWGYRDRSCG